MRVAIRKTDNSKGLIIPAAMLRQAGLETEAELTVEMVHWCCANQPTPPQWLGRGQPSFSRSGG